MSLIATAQRDLIATSMADFAAEHPDLRYLFFGGKGGVGKTVMAGVTAVHIARSGKRVLLASTNPVHSLSGLLDQDVFGRHTPVDGVDGLWALEIDTRQSIERAKKDIKEKIEWFLQFAEIKTKAEEFVGAATTNPAFEESAMFEKMTDLMFDDAYDVYVFDTAPTANARRLLGMSKVYALWVNKMVKSREEAQSLRELLSFTKKKQDDPLMTYLVEFQGRITRARDLLTDADRTAFFFVTLPESLPIAVIRRFIGWFTDIGIPVGGVVVHQVIEPGDLATVPEFVRNRVEMQREHLAAIRDEFPGLVRAVLPLHDDEIRGPAALSATAAELFGSA